MCTVLIKNGNRCDWTMLRKPRVLVDPGREICEIIRRYLDGLSDDDIVLNLPNLIGKVEPFEPSIVEGLRSELHKAAQIQENLDREWERAEADAIASLLSIPDEGLIVDRDKGWHDIKVINRAIAPWFFPDTISGPMSDERCVERICDTYGEEHPVSIKLRRVYEAVKSTQRKEN